LANLAGRSEEESMMRSLALTVALVALAGPCTRAQSPAGLEYRHELLIQIGVTNLDRAIAFYTKALGFEVTERRDDLKFAHVQTNVSGLELGLNEVPKPRGSGSIVLNIGVVDVAAARRALEGRGVVFTGETVVIPGKVALAPFADPDGNVFRLAGPPPKLP
jgi:predicted enzyme related to lactoylglutathione lyase